MLSAFTNATAISEWEEIATTLEMVDQWLTYAPIATITPGQQLFHMAKGAAYLDAVGIPAGSPDTWLTAQIDEFGSSYTQAIA
jgi:hypothetical protein